jgi:hypothetical protein
MELYDAELHRFVHRLSKGDKVKRDEIWEDFDDIVLRKLSIRNYRALVRIWHCQTFEEIAEQFTKDERKKIPLTTDAVRKRVERGMKTIKNYLEEKHVKK